MIISEIFYYVIYKMGVLVACSGIWEVNQVMGEQDS